MTPPHTAPGEVAAGALERLRADVGWACRILAGNGYQDLTLGHVSARDPSDPGRIWIKRRGLTLAEVEPGDVIDLHLDDDPGDAGAHMHLEAVLHTEVYRRRPDVGAVVHGHPPYSTALGATGGQLEYLTHDAVMFERGIATFDESADLITSAAQGASVAAALGDRGAVLLRNHGVLLAQRDVRWLVLAAVTLERAVMLQSIASSLGPLRALDTSVLEDLNRRKYDDSLVAEYWGAWTRELIKRGEGIAGPDGG